MPTFETTGPLAVRVDLGRIRCDVWVSATDRPEASVEVRPRSATRVLDVRATELTGVELVDDRLVVRLTKARLISWLTDGGAVDVVVRVPIGSSLDLSSGMGDLRADGEFGAVDLRTGMGAVEVGHCRDLRVRTGQGDVDVVRVVGLADVGTGSGRLRVGEVDGSAVVSNSNGSSSVGHVTGPVRVKAANGEVDVDLAGGDVTVRSSNGPVRVGEVVRGTTTISTAAGSVDVGVREGTAAWLDLRSKYGRVHHGLTAAGEPDLDRDRGPDGSAETVQVRAHSSYGDVTIHRSTRSQS